MNTMITSVAILSDRYYAASLGPVPQIAVTPVERSDEGQIHDLPKTVRDVRIAAFTPTGVALGCSGRVFFCARVDDIQTGWTYLPTRSDVVALHQEENELFLGTRNGSIRLWDIRLPPSASQQILSLPTSVTHLRGVREAQLLTCLIDGTVNLFDLRFLRAAPGLPQVPVMSLVGHQNSYTLGLGCCVSSERDVVVLAGQDQRIRSWSLRTAEQLKGLPDSQDNPLSRSFLRPIKAMSLSENEGIVDLHGIDGYVSYVWG